MTAQEKRELNEWLATEVMGWYYDDGPYGPWWRNTGHKIVMAFSSWNPLHNIDQCFEWLAPRMRGNSEAETPEAAICLAVKRAWEEK